MEMPMSARTTCIKASFIIAFDGKEHRYLKDGELVYQGAHILFVGKTYPGPVDQTIDAGGKVVSPGFINTHIHMGSSVLDRSFIEVGGTPELGYDTLIDFLMPKHRAMDADMRSICIEYSLAEVLRSGTTTCVEIGQDVRDLLRLVPKYGNRIYFAPMYGSSSWHSSDGQRVAYRWLEDGGLGRMEECVEMIRAHDGACDGLLKGLLSPAQIDTSTPDLLIRTQEWASELQVPVTIHACQSEYEVDNVVARHDKTPIAWINDIGFLNDKVILAHAVYLSGTKWTDYPPGDIEIIAESGASVAHAPWVFCRDGMGLDSFRKYEEAGINMTLGTDTCPQNMIQSMRLASIFSKFAEGNPRATTGADVFNAATLGGAKALGRGDLGRLAPGSRADIVIFSGETMNMVPLRDPVNNIVFSAEMEDVDAVIVNGRTVLEDGQVLGVGDRENEINRRIQQMGELVWSRIPDVDREGRTVDQLSPLSFEPWQGADQ
jgi:5-methylthioadenosine/S-adenosylhomocysteine deaminase